MNQELLFKIIREFEKAPEPGQCALSKWCGVSLGSVYYFISALVAKCIVKAKNSKNAHNKMTYAYISTPSCMRLKCERPASFLKCKQAEYEVPQREIISLKKDLAE